MLRPIAAPWLLSWLLDSPNVEEKDLTDRRMKTWMGTARRGWRSLLIMGFPAVMGAALCWPSSARVLRTTELRVERAGHTATHLKDGRLLIVGGENQNGVVAGSELFDPGLGTISSGPALLAGRADPGGPAFPATNATTNFSSPSACE
jgi:hypothetical protein